MIQENMPVRVSQYPTLLTSENVTTMRSNSLIALIKMGELALCPNLGPPRALSGIETLTLKAITKELMIGKILIKQLLKRR